MAISQTQEVKNALQDVWIVLSSRFVLTLEMEDSFYNVCSVLLNDDSNSGSFLLPRENISLRPVSILNGLYEIQGCVSSIKIQWQYVLSDESDNELSFSVETGDWQIDVHPKETEMLIDLSVESTTAATTENAAPVELLEDVNISSMVLGTVNCALNRSILESPHCMRVLICLWGLRFVNLCTLKAQPKTVMASQLIFLQDGNQVGTIHELVLTNSNLLECNSLEFQGFVSGQGVQASLLQEHAVSICFKTVTSFTFAEMGMKLSTPTKHVQVQINDYVTRIQWKSLCLQLIQNPEMQVLQTKVIQHHQLWWNFLQMTAKSVVVVCNGDCSAGHDICLKQKSVDLYLERVVTSGDPFEKSGDVLDDIKVDLKVEMTSIPQCAVWFQASMAGMYHANPKSLHNLSINAAGVTVVANGMNKDKKDWAKDSVASKVESTSTTAGGDNTWILNNAEAPFFNISSMPCSFVLDLVNVATFGKSEEQLDPIEGDEESTLSTIWMNHVAMLDSHICAKEDRSSDLQLGASDAVAASIGRAAIGVGMATPVGVAASVAAVGVKDGIVGAASRGKESRGVSRDSSYQFGDVTRGVVTSFRKGPSSDNLSSSSSQDGTNNQEIKNESQGYFAENKSRLGAVGGSSIGAAVGLGLVGGPVGLLAGSFLGGRAAKGLLDDTTQQSGDRHTREDGAEDYLPATTINNRLAPGEPPQSDLTSENTPTTSIRGPQEEEAVHPGRRQAAPPQNKSTARASKKKPYQFGDITRGIVARGKEKDNRNASSDYKFGDFTRGLFP